MAEACKVHHGALDNFDKNYFGETMETKVLLEQVQERMLGENDQGQFFFSWSIPIKIEKWVVGSRAFAGRRIFLMSHYTTAFLFCCLFC